MTKKLKIRQPVPSFSQYDRGREVSWRHNRINFLLRHKRLPSDRDDSWVVDGYNFIKRWKAIGRRARRENWTAEDESIFRQDELYFRYPGPYVAYHEYLSNSEARRLQLEAWLLTGEPLERVGDNLGIPEEAVVWYEALFFNVLDRLHLPYYITEQVLEVSLNRGLAHFDVDTVAKFFGYHGGPVILRSILTAYDNAMAVPGEGEMVDKYFTQFVSGRVVSKLSSVINAWQINQFNIEHALEMLLKLKELAAKAESESGSVDRYAEITQTMLDGYAWGVGLKAVNQVLGNNHLAQYFGHGAEPRVSELMDLAAGKGGLSPNDLQRSLPPPRRVEQDGQADEQGS